MEKDGGTGAATASLAMRLWTAVLLLISVIVLATSGSTYGDFVYNFKYSQALKYVMAASVIGLAYSILQAVVTVLRLGGKALCGAGIEYAGDLIISGILLSAASAGAALVMVEKDLLQSNPGSDKILRYSSASVAMQFLGFAFVYFCSVLSARRTFSSSSSSDVTGANTAR